MVKLILFYDSYCPLCVSEMQRLKAADTDRAIDLQDIQQPDFHERFPSLDWNALNARIHGIVKRDETDEGKLISGLDVTYLSWKLVGKSKFVAPLNWKWLRPVLDPCYSFFAKHRYRISYWLTGQKVCKDCRL